MEHGVTRLPAVAAGLHVPPPSHYLRSIALLEHQAMVLNHGLTRPPTLPGNLTACRECELHALHAEHCPWHAAYVSWLIYQQA